MTEYTVTEFAALIGVSVKTLKRWDEAGIFKGYRTPSKMLFYTNKHYIDYYLGSGMDKSELAMRLQCTIDELDSFDKKLVYACPVQQKIGGE